MSVADVSLPQPTRALSIRQPWAWAILYAGKRVENRTWYTSYRGPIYIHAGLKVDHHGMLALEDVIRAVPRPRPPAVTGALVATAIILDCVQTELVPAPLCSWATGPWCLILGDVHPLLDPQPMRGALGLFSVPGFDNVAF
jgi:hypothetical protein